MPLMAILPEDLSDTHSAVPVTLSRSGAPCALQYTCIDLIRIVDRVAHSKHLVILIQQECMKSLISWESI